MIRKWEYEITTFDHLESRAIAYFHSIRKILDKYGQDKWELVSIDYNMKIATFRRPIYPSYNFDKAE